jgi:hypothetical protein
MVSTTQLHAQHSLVSPDSARVQIQTTLRAFYFSLAHHEWEALTADILAAKVVAHRPAPQALVIAGNTPRWQSVKCPSPATALVDQATVTLDGDWAEVSVPRCTQASSGMDEFRLINFERRWRVVYIDLFEEAVTN